MPTNFLSLPSELRNNIYEQLLILHEPIDIRPHWCWLFPPGTLHPKILLANKTVHREASSLLYAQNCFDFSGCGSEKAITFLYQIGRKNASHIRSIEIYFPSFYALGDPDVIITDDSIRFLTSIKSNCTNLSTLKISLGSVNYMLLRLDALDSPRSVSKALALLDTQFRAISSLKEVIFEVYEVLLSGDIRRKMESNGWTVQIKDEIEELDEGAFVAYL
jgi:hypothetical protein